MIPRLIHYCWLSNDPIPKELSKCMASWKVKLPNYEFMLWNFSVFDKKSSLWVQQAFDNKKYAFAADYIRLFAVYNYGGIYLDMDMEVIKSFDDLLDRTIMIAVEDNNTKAIEAGCFGAEKGNILIKKCLDYYTNRSFIDETGKFSVIPLPKIMQSILSDSQICDFLSSDYFTSKSLKTGQITITKNTHTVHHFAGSWTSKAEQDYKVIKMKIFRVFGNKIGVFIAIPFFIWWQIADKGFLGAITEIIKKIKKTK